MQWSLTWSRPELHSAEENTCISRQLINIRCHRNQTVCLTRLNELIRVGGAKRVTEFSVDDMTHQYFYCHIYFTVVRLQKKVSFCFLFVLKVNQLCVWCKLVSSERETFTLSFQLWYWTKLHWSKKWKEHILIRGVYFLIQLWNVVSGLIQVSQNLSNVTEYTFSYF